MSGKIALKRLQKSHPENVRVRVRVRGPDMPDINPDIRVRHQFDATKRRVA